MTITASGSYVTNVAQGQTYNVVVRTQPVGQTCAVENGTGVVTGPVSNIRVTCTTNTYAVGGTVTGLAGALRLRLNGTADLLLTENGAFRFESLVSHGSAYAVTVVAQPGDQACSVEAGTGVAVAPVTQVRVLCSTCLLYTSPSPRDVEESRMPSSA